MPSTEAIARNFSIPDIDMLERAQVFHDTFANDIADFTAAFPHLAAPFNADFQTAIDAADAIPPGSVVDAEITVYTEQLDAKMELARKAMQKLFTYVKITFNSYAKLVQAGKTTYEKVRRSQTGMKELLEQAHDFTTETTVNAALLAAGYTAADVTQLQTLRNEIHELNKTQERLKRERIEKSQTRIIAMNTVWGFMEQINEASKVVYVDNPAKLTMYLLYPTVSHSLSKPQNMSATPNITDPTTAVLEWDAVIDATYYKVYYSLVNPGAPSGTFNELGETSTNEYHTPITSGKRNYWKIKAYNESQSSAYSDEVFLDA